ncbi:unnamed protein product [Gordionus sp. m RMFG-2023]
MHDSNLNHAETCKPIQNVLPLSSNIILEQLNSNFQDDPLPTTSQAPSLNIPNQGDIPIASTSQGQSLNLPNQDDPIPTISGTFT